MAELFWIAVFALGILVSVGLHEAGHAGTARAFGMKVTRFFIGFGPTLFSFRKGETEYGVKAIPAGAFVKIVGMTPQDDDVEPADEPRAMWRFPVWKRTIVMSAGSAAHFALGLAILWGLFAFMALPDQGKLETQRAAIAEVSPCVSSTLFEPGTTKIRECTEATDGASPAKRIGLRAGDVVVAVDGQPVSSWNATTEKIRAAGGRQLEIAYDRDGAVRTATVTLPTAERIRDRVPIDTPLTEITPADLQSVGVLGIAPVVPRTTAGPIKAFGMTWDQTVLMFKGTFESLKKFPEKVPKLWAALTGAERDPETPISVIGASRIGGELGARGEWPAFLLLLAALNFFVGIFNLLPLLPLDGGHIAIAWFERVRSWLYARLGRADPGRVDYYKLMPVTYVVILIFGGFFLLTVAADIINPITLF
jgi:membrane-associated protease RseP (regulator of RpoE activity)